MVFFFLKFFVVGHPLEIGKNDRCLCHLKQHFLLLAFCFAQDWMEQQLEQQVNKFLKMLRSLLN